MFGTDCAIKGDFEFTFYHLLKKISQPASQKTKLVITEINMSDPAFVTQIENNPLKIFD